MKIPVIPPTKLVFDFKANSINKAAVLARQKQYVAPAVKPYYADPLLAVQGKMQYIFDETGKRYLDAFGGIVTVCLGHNNPELVQAVQSQLNKLQHTTHIYVSEPMGEFAEALVKTMPKGSGLDTVYVVNSGSEANDIASVASRVHTQNYDIIALRNAYHGLTVGAMGLTAHSTWRQNYPSGFGMHWIQNPDRYHGPFGYDDPKAGEKYAKNVEEAILYETPGKVAGFIAEPIQGVGGFIEMPPNFLKEAYKHTRNAGGICVADEVQTGMGRLGGPDFFWGFEKHQVTPDIVSMAKSLGNGVPIAAVVMKREIAESLAKNKIYMNTFGGNPVSCTQALNVLKIIKRDNLMENVRARGDQIIQGLKNSQKTLTQIGDIRGHGLLIGLELVESQESKKPDGALALAVMEKARELGLLVGRGGFFGNVLRITPSYIITKEDAAFIVDVLNYSIEFCSKKK